jgi:hypothetical protein
MVEASRRKGACILCVALCATFAALAWCAVSGKSATVDEPGHTATGWFMLYARDFRWSAEVPPLWEDLIALPMGSGGIKYDADSPNYKNIRIRRDISTWEMHMLYETPGNDGVELVRRGRMVALLMGVLLAALIGRWSWRLAGPVAGVAALFMFVWDPNFLGHSPLAKNDVGITLAYLAAAYAFWRVGEKFSWVSAVMAILAITAAVLTKFSGLLLGPLMVVILGWRALDRFPWTILGKVVVDRKYKLAAVAALAASAIVFIYIAIWTIYGFRFDAGPNGLQLDTTPFLGTLRDVQTFKIHNKPPSQQELDDWQPPASTRAMLWVQTHHLLPQAWIAGFIITQAGSEARLCFLDGKFYNGGRWDYFPKAAMYKSPLATIIALVAAAWIGFRAARRIWRDQTSRWALVALGIPAGAYAYIAITSNINIGLRHFFPFYPFVFIGIGLAAARLWQSGTFARVLVSIVGIGLVAETVAAYPNYLNFFDILIGPKNGYSLLSDSNIDWGQDLPALKAWQDKNPDVPLYLDYFGRCDPAAYDIKYFNLEGGYEYGPPFVIPDRAGVIAVSATNLHLAQAYDPPPPWYDFIKGHEPEQVLNGSIYLFRINPHQPD